MTHANLTVVLCFYICHPYYASMFLYISTQNMNVNDITLEKALKLLLGKDVKQCGRPRKKPKLEEAVVAM